MNDSLSISSRKEQSTLSTSTYHNVYIDDDPTIYKQERLFIENYLMCPISYDIMTDPVIDREGNTYDKKHILRWLDEKKPSISPKTKNPLKEEWLVPNRILKNIIEDYKSNKKTNFSDGVNLIIENMRQKIEELTEDNKKMAVDLDDAFYRNKKMLEKIDDLSLLIEQQYMTIKSLSSPTNLNIIPYTIIVNLSEPKYLYFFSLDKKLTVIEKQELKNSIEKFVLESFQKYVDVSKLYLNYGSRTNLTFTYDDKFESYVFFDMNTNQPFEKYGSNFICYLSGFNEVTIARIPKLNLLKLDYNVNLNLHKGYSRNHGRSFLATPIYEIYMNPTSNNTLEKMNIDNMLEKKTISMMFNDIKFIDDEKFEILSKIPDDVNVSKIFERRKRFKFVDDFTKIIEDI